MLFASYIGCLEIVAKLGALATAGNVQKWNPHLTIGQVKRVLCQLEGEGYVEKVLESYGRTGRWVYSVTEKCHTNMFIVNSAIERSIQGEKCAS